MNGVAAARSREDLKNAEGKTIIRIRPQTPRINLLEIKHVSRGGEDRMQEGKSTNAINFAVL